MAIALVCQPGRYDHEMVQWIFGENERIVGCRVRQIGHLYIEIHNMLMNLRVVVTDSTVEYAPGLCEPVGYGWCYPKNFGYPFVAGLIWAWEFCKADPGKIDPPGPWIKAVHSGIYREPGINQPGYEGKVIWCPGCGRKSANPNDIKQRYCGNCHKFHELIGWTTGDE